MTEQIKILFLSSEVVPFAKTGGLADVAGTLPAVLKGMGADIRLVLPYYRIIREGGFKADLLFNRLEVPFGREKLSVNVFVTETEEGIPVYLIEREDLYDRPNLYGNSMGDYYDNIERFTFFDHAALKIAEGLGFRPDVIHCHDWQTGIVPALIKGPYKESPVLSGTPVLFTFHNLGHQGIFPADKLHVTGLSADKFFHMEGLEYWGNISLLKAGIVYSDTVTTVSPTYALEVQTGSYGMGMEGILYQKRSILHGILNGVDYRFWDPATDIHLSANYSSSNMTGKERCKDFLIQEMGILPSLRERPLLGIISRLEAQKGFDLLEEIIEDVIALNVGVVVLGTGEVNIQKAFEDAVNRYPGRISFHTGFNEPLAHRIMAGADIFLVPSRYEPCGLTQIYALRYGTVPVVRATGGLNDTIDQFDPRTGEGNGFKFIPYKSAAFFQALCEAEKIFRDKKAWEKLMENGMKADFSWGESARRYLEIYRSIMDG